MNKSKCKVARHYRSEHMVRGHFRNCRYRGRIWIDEHLRSGSFVNDHCYI